MQKQITSLDSLGIHDMVFVPFEKIRGQNKYELYRRLDYWKSLGETKSY